MKKFIELIIGTFIIAIFSYLQISAATYDVKKYGAIGDGKVLDTPSINKVIEDASANGGGTVYFPAGTYLSVTIHLKSNVTLYLEQGAIILAADPKQGYKFDSPEENQWDMYQDFGHTHWQNSLIWGENLENVSILGLGLIDGSKLIALPRELRTPEEQKALEGKAPAGKKMGPFGYPQAADVIDDGYGNKAISLKLCRNVILRDISILRGGHFAILATGVDNFTVDNLKIDTNRDGIDIDCCKNVRVSNCTVNSPVDDGICLKTSFGLGYAKSTEDVTITNCLVCGYDVGTVLDGTYKREYVRSGQKKPIGRIKFGTESNGDYKNITISNCVFDYCRGLALETVDGSNLEDITITNITMRDIVNSPIFLRLGRRMRGPDGVPIGNLRRVIISNVVVYNAVPENSVLIVGLPEKNIEDVLLNNIKIYYKGGGTKEQAEINPPENETMYPEPERFGEMPAYGFFVRHVKGIKMNNIDVRFEKDDMRPPFVLNDVKNAEFNFIDAQLDQGVPTFVLKDVSNFSVFKCKTTEDKFINNASIEKF
jgi:polygalacturonase